MSLRIIFDFFHWYFWNILQWFPFPGGEWKFITTSFLDNSENISFILNNNTVFKMFMFAECYIIVCPAQIFVLCFFLGYPLGIYLSNLRAISQKFFGESKPLINLKSLSRSFSEILLVILLPSIMIQIEFLLVSS